MQDNTTNPTALPAALRDHARGPATDMTYRLMLQAADLIEEQRAEIAAARHMSPYPCGETL